MNPPKIKLLGVYNILFFVLQRNQTLPVVDIKHFLNTVEQLNNKFALYLNKSSTNFGINMTEFQKQLEMEVANLPNTANPLMMSRYRTAKLP